VLKNGRSEWCLRTDEELIWCFGGGCVEVFGQSALGIRPRHETRNPPPASTAGQDSQSLSFWNSLIARVRMMSCLTRSYTNLAIPSAGQAADPVIPTWLTWDARTCSSAAPSILDPHPHYHTHRCVVATTMPPPDSWSSSATTSPTFLVCLVPPRRRRPSPSASALGESSSSSR
jgi:hypothetical protein